MSSLQSLSAQSNAAVMVVSDNAQVKLDFVEKEFSPLFAAQKDRIKACFLQTLGCQFEESADPDLQYVPNKIILRPGYQNWGEVEDTLRKHNPKAHNPSL